MARCAYTHFRKPAVLNAHAEACKYGFLIQNALDPVKVPSKVKRFSPEEIAEMNRQLKERT